MSSAWIYQDDHMVKKHGADHASYYVGWIEPDGTKRCKSCGPGPQGKRTAERLRRKVEAELMTGTYQVQTRKLWPDFRKEYRTKVLEARAPRTMEEAEISLNHFERIVKPVRMFALGAGHLDSYVAARRQETNHRGEPISPATINKELRHIRAAVRKAKRWNYLSYMLEFEFLREPGKLPTYITPEHFAAVYQACDQAEYPNDQPYPAGDWWRGILITAYLTGWRIGSLLALKREDVNLDDGTVISRWGDNKGKRDQIVPLHPLVIEHLRKLAAFEPKMFPWHRRRGKVFEQFGLIQAAAGVKPAGKDRYGFHDIRRAFATMNADRMTGDALQALMQHKSYTTTQKYIYIGRQLNPTVQNLFVPNLKTAMEG